jgi:hypothetical protein
MPQHSVLMNYSFSSLPSPPAYVTLSLFPLITVKSKPLSNRVYMTKTDIIKTSRAVQNPKITKSCSSLTQYNNRIINRRLEEYRPHKHNSLGATKTPGFRVKSQQVHSSFSIRCPKIRIKSFRFYRVCIRS